MTAIHLLMALEEALRAPDWADRVRALCTPDCEFVDVGPGEISDIEGFIKTESNVMVAWSDVTTQEVAVLGDEHHAMAESMVEATHDGPLLWHGTEFQPSGRVVKLRVVRIISVQDGKIASIRDYFNDVSFMRQQGIPITVAESAELIV